MNREIFSFHLATVDPFFLTRELLRSPKSTAVPGLLHAEPMLTMRLGSPITSAARYGFTQLVYLARWQDEKALTDFLQKDRRGMRLDKGWHVRLKFYRRWGFVSELDPLPENSPNPNPEAPVVAITLARLKLSETLRFLRWGKPVEGLVRDHPGKTFALAAMRPLGTLSTFSIWKTEREMIQMVQGLSPVPGGGLHADAMVEQRKKSFHHEFTTMRFQLLGEFGKMPK